MALSFTNYESVLQQKLNAVTSGTTPQDLLLISKSVQSTVGNLVVADIQSSGTTQVGLVQSAGTAQIAAVNAAGTTKLNDLQSYYNSVVLGAPAALDTLDELAAALNDDANFASTVTTALNARVTKSTFTTKGDIIAASANSNPIRVAVGSDGTALLADSTQTSGVRWGKLSDSGTQILSIMGAI